MVWITVLLSKVSGTGIPAGRLRYLDLLPWKQPKDGRIGLRLGYFSHAFLQMVLCSKQNRALLRTSRKRSIAENKKFLLFL